MVEEFEDGCELISDEKEEERVAIPEISLHALFDILTPQTMRVVGTVRGRQLHVLIDSWSTHNFVNANFAKKMGCDKVAAPAFQVMVANGDRLQCDEIYKSVPMEIQGYKFHISMYPLELQGFDVVLGVQWLQSLGRVIYDWKNLTMEFTMDGKKHVIRGDPIKTILHGVVHSLQELMANGLTMFMMQMVKVTNSLPLNAIVGEQTQELEHLLTEYQQIFQVPTTLPLPRSRDHQINLEPSTGPVNVRPY